MDVWAVLCRATWSGQRFRLLRAANNNLAALAGRAVQVSGAMQLGAVDRFRNRLDRAQDRKKTRADKNKIRTVL